MTDEPQAPYEPPTMDDIAQDPDVHYYTTDMGGDEEWCAATIRGDQMTLNHPYSPVPFHVGFSIGINAAEPTEPQSTEDIGQAFMAWQDAWASFRFGIRWHQFDDLTDKQRMNCASAILSGIHPLEAADLAMQDHIHVASGVTSDGPGGGLSELLKAMGLQNIGTITVPRGAFDTVDDGTIEVDFDTADLPDPSAPDGFNSWMLNTHGLTKQNAQLTMAEAQHYAQQWREWYQAGGRQMAFVDWMLLKYGIQPGDVPDEEADKYHLEYHQSGYANHPFVAEDEDSNAGG